MLSVQRYSYIFDTDLAFKTKNNKLIYRRVYILLILFKDTDYPLCDHLYFQR